MLTMILGLVPGLLSAYTAWAGKQADARTQMFMAQTGATRDVAVAALTAQAQVQTKWAFAAWPPALIGFAIAAFVLKAVVWDKVIASFVGCSGHQPPGVCTSFATDPLTGDLSVLFTYVIASYFGYAVVNLLKK